MKRIVLISLMFFAAGFCQAQWIASKFRVTFTDKKNSPYSLTQPQQYLSQKAINRRMNQSIPFDSTDLPVNPWYLDSVRNTGVTLLNVSKWFNCVTIYTTDSSKIAAIKSFPFVKSIDSLAETPLKKGAKRHPVNIDSSKGGGNMAGMEMAFDFIFQKQESLLSAKSYNYGPSAKQVQMIKTDVLHNLGYCGQGMTIAVLDAGFYKVDSLAVFDSLWAKGLILGTRDFVNPGGSVFSSGTHGTMVLSIMGGNSPGNLIGTAPKAGYWLLRTEDGATEYPIEEDNWASGAEFADSVGADIINSSLGYTVYDNPHWSYTYADMNGKTARSTQAAVMAARKGILVCNSAGNSGAGPWNYIGAPADADSILSVGAVDSSKIYASFSSNGPTYDQRVKPDVCAMGKGTYVTNMYGGVMPGNGTSFSSPIIAGSVACLWQANPSMTNMEILRVVQQSADRYLNPDTCYGYGIPDMSVANLILSLAKKYNIDIKDEISVSPNPFTDKISIIFYSSDSGVVSLELFNMAGKSVFKRQNVRKEAGFNYIPLHDLQGLSPGFYVLKLYTKNKILSAKVMKS